MTGFTDAADQDGGFAIENETDGFFELVVHRSRHRLHGGGFGLDDLPGELEKG